MICHRCNSVATSMSGSWFSAEMLCDDCQYEERNHPDYEYVRWLELRALTLRSDTNWVGPGWPGLDGRVVREHVTPTLDEVMSLVQENPPALDGELIHMSDELGGLYLFDSETGRILLEMDNQFRVLSLYTELYPHVFADPALRDAWEAKIKAHQDAQTF